MGNMLEFDGHGDSDLPASDKQCWQMLVVSTIHAKIRKEYDTNKSYLSFVATFAANDKIEVEE